MESKKLTPQLHVASQISIADIATIAAQGFKTILNNRPDGEGEGQPMAADIAAAAEQHGIKYIYQPVVGTAISDGDAENFGKNIANNDGPIFAHCRTGTRCTILWMLSQAKDTSADELLATAAKAGYSLEQVRGRLEGIYG
ncbi:MAG: TIGR01244 family phosphatase [Gammaproteobacteria bacterium]|nr:TIGR01244 family phosphatase [Gammaproteobacteria bacterium]MBQ0839061.1 TIGR01244 family phosphatase [Gammaproteobacteria bacterium]